MNAEFFSALEQLEKEKGISQKYMLEKIELALQSAFKREYGATALRTPSARYRWRMHAQ